MFKNANQQTIKDYPNFSIKVHYDKVCDDHVEFKDYFPDYHSDYIPQRKFFWTLYLSLFPDDAEADLEKYWARKLGQTNDEDTHFRMHVWFLEDFKNY